MFQFRRFPTYDYFIHHRLLNLLLSGFPHSDTHGSMAAFAYKTVTFCGVPSHALRLDYAIHVTVRTPQILLLTVWPLPRSLATTGGISVDFFSSPYLDVSVQAVSLIQLLVSCLLYDDGAYPVGFPHSDIHGSMSAFDSLWLFADCCVLLRLLVPRHSPCALCSLTIFKSFWFFYSSLTLDDIS